MVLDTYYFPWHEIHSLWLSCWCFLWSILQGLYKKTLGRWGETLGDLGMLFLVYRYLMPILETGNTKRELLCGLCGSPALMESYVLRIFSSPMDMQYT